METVAVGLHIFICLFLIGVILLQAGKGADIGAVFGGASQTLFGGRGPATFLNKLTIVVSVIFLLTSVWLAKIGHHKGSESVVGKVPVEEAVPVKE
ncbi:MAG: preprotein translocase subunit SecG [Deltaproteobacteria bacterium]|nr:preprotein translocase subunit SecG [Deltaproteobacteria bacterium]MBI4223744.1 preprotein translocase subunit SecG [Deltaproteobacteria bacterium]